MKYTIMGFSQKAVVDLVKSGHKIDVSDLAILRWLVDFSHTDKMVKVVDGGKTYYWVNYQSVLDDLPVLNIGRRMLAVRLQKMADAGILCSSLKKNGGTFTLYGFGPKYETLIAHDISWGDKKFTGWCQNIDTPGDKKFTPPVTKNCQPKYPSTNNPSTNDQSTNMDEGRKRPTPPEMHKHGEYGWVKLSDAEYQRLLSEYGEQEVARAIRHVDESAQNTGNRNGWKDWNLTVRRCIRDGWGKQKGGNYGNGTGNDQRRGGYSGPENRPTKRLKNAFDFMAEDQAGAGAGDCGDFQQHTREIDISELF